MNQLVDPRTLGFNYGRAWGPEPLPPVYRTGAHIAQVLAKEARAIGDRAWRLEEALRNVRLASSPSEKELTLMRLEEELATYIPT